MNLHQSVREWVLANLPVESSDHELLSFLRGKDAHSLLVTYINWASRHISPTLREVHLSNALQSNPLFRQFDEQVEQIVNDIKTGSSLTKYLSRGVRIAAQFPQSNINFGRRRDLDLMLNDWGMHHLHLSTEIEDDGFVSRTGPLLFGIFQRNDAYLVDIVEHNNWTSKHLLEVLVREFPDSGCFHELRGVVGLSHDVDEEEHRQLRNAGINTAHMVDGKAIMPAGGMVASGTTALATREADRVLIALEEFETRWKADPAAIRQTLSSAGFSLPEEPEFSFDVHPSYGPGLLEAKSGNFIKLQ